MSSLPTEPETTCTLCHRSIYKDRTKAIAFFYKHCNSCYKKIGDREAGAEVSPHQNSQTFLFDNPGQIVRDLRQKNGYGSSSRELPE